MSESPFRFDMCLILQNKLFEKGQMCTVKSHLNPATLTATFFNPLQCNEIPAVTFVHSNDHIIDATGWKLDLLAKYHLTMAVDRLIAGITF